MNTPPKNQADSKANLNPEEKEMKAKRKYYGKIFVTLIFSLIFYEYYIYVYQIMWKKTNSNLINFTLANNYMSVLICLAGFHLLLFMMIWSLIVTMVTHPGEIPLYWGFYIGDEDYKRKRYCLICNAFKPERSHHCSVCNICVLNMDHHCPWVDNCIGFYNRKYFMQLLFYLCLLSIFIVSSVGYDIYLIIKEIIHMKLRYSDHIRAGIIVIAYGIITTLSILISMFFKFHVNLVLNNSTTIESLDKEHASEYKKVYLINFYISLIFLNTIIGCRFSGKIVFTGFSHLLLKREDLKEMASHGK
jgi:palmitoyltransferase